MHFLDNFVVLLDPLGQVPVVRREVVVNEADGDPVQLEPDSHRPLQSEVGQAEVLSLHFADVKKVPGRPI